MLNDYKKVHFFSKDILLNYLARLKNDVYLACL